MKLGPPPWQIADMAIKGRWVYWKKFSTDNLIAQFMLMGVCSRAGWLIVGLGLPVGKPKGLLSPFLLKNVATLEEIRLEIEAISMFCPFGENYGQANQWLLENWIGHRCFTAYVHVFKQFQFERKWGHKESYFAAKNNFVNDLSNSLRARWLDPLNRKLEVLTWWTRNRLIGFS